MAFPQYQYQRPQHQPQRPQHQPQRPQHQPQRQGIADEDQSRYVPQFRVIPFVHHCERGQYFKRFTICKVAAGIGNETAFNLAVHFYLNESRLVLIDTATCNALLYATEGLGEYLSTTHIYNSADNSPAGTFIPAQQHLIIRNLMSQQRNPREFRCFHTTRGHVVQAQADVARIQYNNTIGPCMNFLTFQGLTMRERNLLIILTIKIFASFCQELMMMPLIPVGYLAWLDPATTSIEPTTTDSLQYVIATLENVRFVVSNYQDSRRKVVNILKDNCRILFTLEIGKIGTDTDIDEDALMHVNDNFGVTFFQATGFKVNQQLVVYDKNNRVMGYAEPTGCLYARGTRPNTYIYNGSNQRILEVRYSINEETMEIAILDKACQCEIYTISNPNIRVAKMWVNFNRLHMKVTPVNTVPLQYKLLALFFGAKIVNRFYTKKFKNQLCTPHLGYIG